jgi:hypothetical protein
MVFVHVEENAGCIFVRKRQIYLMNRRCSRSTIYIYLDEEDFIFSSCMQGFKEYTPLRSVQV